MNDEPLTKEQIDELLYDIEYMRGTPLHRMQAKVLLVKAGVMKPDDDAPEPKPEPKKPVSDEQLPRARDDKGRPPPPIAEPVMKWMKDVAKEPVEWLWEQRVPIGKITMIVGDPGLGKSQVTVSLAATISCGGSFPDYPGERVKPGSVLIMNAEDNLADTIKPRLEWAGADMNRVAAMTTVEMEGGRLSPFTIGRDLRTLDLALSRMTDPRLVIIDPVTSFLGGADEHKSGEVREAVDPLKALAEKHKVSLVLVNHFNKGMGAKAIYRSMGSIAFTGAARIVWAVTEHPKKKCVQVMTFVKSNVSAPAGGLAFVMDKSDGGRFSWLAEPVPWTANEVMAMLRDSETRTEGEGKRGPRAHRTRAVMDLVLEQLKDGAVLLGKVNVAAQDQLLASRKAVNDAIKRLEKKVRKFTGDDGLTWLELHEDLGLEGDHGAVGQ